jgi:hypothetical protein
MVHFIIVYNYFSVPTSLMNIALIDEFICLRATFVRFVMTVYMIIQTSVDTSFIYIVCQNMDKVHKKWCIDNQQIPMSII